MSTAPPLASLPPNPDTLPMLPNEEIRRLQRVGKFYVPDASERVHPNCVTCGGEGQFRWYDNAGLTDKIVTYECNCRDQWQLYAIFTSANILVRYQRLCWGDLGGTSYEAKVFVDEYLKRAPQHIRAGRGMFLHGETGTGKSSLAALALKKIISLGYDGYYLTFADLVDAYTKTWRDNEEKEWFYRRIKNATVLVVDDLGKEYKGREGIASPLVDEVFRHRVASANPTIITSNLDTRDIGQRYGRSIWSLLNESVKGYEFTGDDFRGRANSRTDEELKEDVMRPVVIE